MYKHLYKHIASHRGPQRPGVARRTLSNPLVNGLLWPIVSQRDNKNIMPESLKLTGLFVGLNLCTTNPGPELKGNKAGTNTVFHNASPQYLIAVPKL